MKKAILNLGKALNKAEQKQINGGVDKECGVRCRGERKSCCKVCGAHGFYYCPPGIKIPSNGFTDIPI